MIRVGSVCSGIGGLDLGFHGEPYELVWMCERDPKCKQVLARRFPGVPVYNDMTTIHATTACPHGGCESCVPDVDVLIGGTPCQSFSLAGRREGMDGESGLFLHFARLVRELAPEWLLWENVPGVLSLDGGEVFADIVEFLSGSRPVVPQDGWRSSGFGFGTERGIAWRLLDAQFFGVPQRRRRVFVVGHLGAPWSAPAEVLLEPDSSRRDLATSTEEGEDDAPGVEGGVGADGFAGRNAGSDRQRAGDLVSALTSSDGGIDFDMAEAGHLIPQRAQGFGADSTIAGTLGAKQGPRPGIPDDMDRAGALVLEEALLVGDGFKGEVARTITAHGQGHRYDLDTENFVVDNEGPITFRKSGRAQSEEAAETWVEDDVSNTLNGFDASSARSTHAIVETIPVDLRNCTRSDPSTGVGTPGAGWGDAGDPSYPLSTMGAPPAITADLIVRRLTPLECERLQGFPDGWTDEQADTNRYKQLGNAVAVPCARWLADRIARVHDSFTH